MDISKLPQYFQAAKLQRAVKYLLNVYVLPPNAKHATLKAPIFPSTYFLIVLIYQIYIENWIQIRMQCEAKFPIMLGALQSLSLHLSSFLH